MRHVPVVALAILMGLASTALAQQSGDTRGSAYISDFSFSRSEAQGFRLEEGGFGFSLMHFFKPYLSAELSLGFEQRYSYHRVIYYNPPPQQPSYIYEDRRFTSHPVDAMAQYHFLNGTRWIPYAGLGARYANGPDGDSRIDAQIAGGVLFNITRSFALRFDARQILGNTSTEWNPAFKPSVGVSWKFGGGAKSAPASH